MADDPGDRLPSVAELIDELKMQRAVCKAKSKPLPGRSMNLAALFQRQKQASLAQPLTDQPAAQQEPLSDQPAVETQPLPDQPAVGAQPLLDQAAVEAQLLPDQPASQPSDCGSDTSTAYSGLSSTSGRLAGL